MKKYLMLVSIVCLVAAVQASDIDWSADWTQAEYVKNMIEVSKDVQYWSPTEKILEARFEEIDTDGDGLLSQAERKAAKKKSSSAPKPDNMKD